MKRECSIRLFVAGVILASAAGICGGFFAGTQRNWNGYEKRIAQLEEDKQELEKEADKREDDIMESLNVVEPYEYVLIEEHGFVAVYHTDRKNLYASTDIQVSELPQKLQKEITEGKYIGSEEELYNFLESYSS